MDIDVFTEAELDTVLRVLRTALNPLDPLTTPQRRFLNTYAAITGHMLDAEVPKPLAAETVQLCDPHKRKRLVQLAGLAVLAGNPVSPASVAFLQALARQLETRDSVVDVATALAHGRRQVARFIAMRRSMRALLTETYRSAGIHGVLRLIGAMFIKHAGDGARLLAYRQLESLPEGTLGREYWKHLTANGFAFPGEPGGIAESVAYHDVAHVLAEHDTTPEGEIQQGAFQAGNRREDGFFFVLFVTLQFHHGVRCTPVAPPSTGLFDPERILWAIHRGAQCRIDMTHQWNFWPLMPLTLAEARERCGLLPKARPG